MGKPKRVQRRSLSCARCRRRKISCDARSPSCSACADADAPCLAWNPATNATAPRSITAYLEERIAALENEISSSPASNPASVMPMRGNSAIGNVLGDTTPSFLGLVQESRMAGCVAISTQIPSVHAMSDLNENHPRAIVNQQSSILAPTSVPSRVAEFLLFTYTTGIIAQCPIFSEEEAKNAFDAVLSVGFNSPDCDTRNVYTVSLIMAISLSTAARNKLTRARSLATALFKNAMLHISTVMTNDLPGLQALLLLIHYTFLNPTVGNLWLLTGISSEACIELGLHQELTAGMDDHVLDQRRRIFWCAWEMEVAVSAAFRRPIRTLNKYISASFPSYSQSPSAALRSIAIFIWRFRQLEAELISILYSNDPLPSEVSPLEDWMASMENKVCDWAQEVQRSAALSDGPSTKSQWCEMVLYADIAYHHCLVLLYGPSNRVKSPTRSNIKRAFQASVRVAVGYWEQANTEFGRIKYTFHTCYHTFSAAVVFLRVLRSCKPDITQLFTLTELEEYASCFVRILSSIGERWPAATRCLEEFNHLLGPIMKSYSDFFLFAQHDDLLQPDTQDPFQTSNFFADAFDVLDYENFIQFFNPPPGVVDGSLPTPPAVVPFDWDMEFEFGMNELPVNGLDLT